METPPSILLVVSDDHAAWALHDHPLGLSTPNLDRLRDEGTRFVEAFTPSPVCSPARACLMTGRMPSEVGIHDWLDESDPDVARRDWLADQSTLPQSLQQAGYQTFLSGKWHLGHPGKVPPGFDQAFCMSPRMRTHHDEDVYYLNGDKSTLDGNRSELITDQAVRFLEEAKSEQPFFLNVGYFATHSPYSRSMHDPDTLADLPGFDFSRIPRCPAHPNAKNENGPHPEKNPESERRSRWMGYTAGVAEIDKGVGRILDSLEKSGRLENTLIVYTSDHGCCLGHHGIWGKGNGTRPVNFTDTSLRIPLLIRGPGFSAGVEDTHPVTHLDTHATLLEIAGVANTETSGHSLRSNRGQEQAVFAEYGHARMIRTPDWKWIRQADPSMNELYHLAEDPDETENLAQAKEHADICQKLEARMNWYFLQHSIPEHNGLSVCDQPVHNPYEPWNSLRTQTNASL